MLKNVMNATDINGNDITRKSFKASANEFYTLPQPIGAKFIPHEIVELHGDRFAACLRFEQSVMLVETSLDQTNVLVMSDMDTSIYSDAKAEAIAQLDAYIKAKQPPAKKAKAVKNSKTKPVVAPVEEAPVKPKRVRKSRAKPKLAVDPTNANGDMYAD